MNNLKFYFIVALLFSIFCFNTDVFAATDTSDVIFNVPNKDDIYSYEDFYFSNSLINKDTSLTIRNLSYGKNNKYYYKSLTYPSSGTPTFYYNDSLKFGNKYEDDVKFTLNQFDFSFRSEHFILNYDTKYQLLIKFNKAKLLEYYDTHKIFSEEFKAIQLKVKNLDNDRTINITDNISLLEADWYVPKDKEDDTKNSNTAYILLSFKYNKDEDLDGFKNWALHTITLQSGFLFTDKLVGDQTFKISYMAFMENSNIVITGFNDKDDENFEEIHENLDKVHEDDIIIFDKYETCDGVDFGCWSNNIFSFFKNMFTRIGNGFNAVINGIWTAIKWLGDFVVEGFKVITDYLKLLFVPDKEFIKSNFDTLRIFFNEKLGIVAYPFEFIYDVFNMILNYDVKSTVIHIPDVVLPIPGIDGHIIHATDFDLMDIIGEAGVFHNAYLMYLTFVKAMIGIWLILLAQKTYRKVVEK